GSPRPTSRKARVSAAAFLFALLLPSAEDPELVRRSLALVCRPADNPCPGRCLVPRPNGQAGYCTTSCSENACPAGSTCLAIGAKEMCTRGPLPEADVVPQFHRRFPGERAKLAEQWYRWFEKNRSAYQADLVAQIFLVSGLVAIPDGRDWEVRFLEDVLFFV